MAEFIKIITSVDTSHQTNVPIYTPHEQGKKHRERGNL